MAAAAAAVNRPLLANQGPNAGNPHTHPDSSVPNSEQQDPGLHGTNQDPGPSSHPQHRVSARPVFYVPAPPPPAHFLQYQWPMPFSYNPFGFPGMGYGMVMPPFPPPPYMEAPAYILPNPHIQPIDYRHLLHPQGHVPSASYRNPNQNHRIRPPHTVRVRETVNSAVQTEPTQRAAGAYGDGSPPVSSDSGHGTASNSPSLSSSGSQKRSSAEVENYPLMRKSGNAEDLQVKRTCTNGQVKHCFDISRPTGKDTVQSGIKATAETQICHKDGVGQENDLTLRNGHHNIWSVSSPDSMVPVCSSSQQEDEVTKERRISVPDILLSWGRGTPQETVLKMAEKVLCQNDPTQSHKTETEHEKSVYQSPSEPKNCLVVADSADANDDTENILRSQDGEPLFKVLKLSLSLHELMSESGNENEPVGLLDSVKQCLPFRDEPLHSLHKCHKLSDDEQENSTGTNPYEDTAEIIPYQISLNGCQMKKKMNESVWSVESLAPFIPTKEWLLQKSIFEPEIIVEMTEEAENGRLLTLNDNVIVKSSKERRQSRRFSSTDSVPMSDSWLIFSTPAEKQSQSTKPNMESDTDVSEMREPNIGQNMANLPSTIGLSTPTAQEVDKNGSSEPEANQSPNQESLIVHERQEKSHSSSGQEETLPLNSVAEEKCSSTRQLILQNGVEIEAGADETCGNEIISRIQNEPLCIPVADQRVAEVSPSKGQLVDCGIQCTTFQEVKCACEKFKSSMEPSRRHPFKYSDMKEANSGRAEGMKKTLKRHGQRRRGQERLNGQQEVYSEYYGKPGKFKGGKEEPRRNPRY